MTFRPFAPEQFVVRAAAGQSHGAVADLGDLPSWRLEDLYPSASSDAFRNDMKKADADAIALARNASVLNVLALALPSSSSSLVSNVGTELAMPVTLLALILPDKPPVTASSARMPSQRRFTWS